MQFLIKTNNNGNFKKKGYFSLGLGSSMSDSDMFVIEIVDNLLTLNDYYSSSHDIPSLDTSLGGE